MTILAVPLQKNILSMNDKYIEMCPQCLYCADLLTLNKLFRTICKKSKLGCVIRDRRD